MNRRLTSTWIVIAALLLTGWSAEAIVWYENYSRASTKAKEKDRYMLLHFCSSDCTGDHNKLAGAVLTEKVFKDYADGNLLCIIVDMPHRTWQSDKIKAQNQKLWDKYNAIGSPSLVLLSPAAKKLAEFGRGRGDAAAYVDLIKKEIEKDGGGPTVKAAAVAPAPGQAETNNAAASDLIPEDENRKARTWTAKNGDMVVASLVKVSGKFAHFRKLDGKDAKIPLSSLSKEDVSYIAELSKSLKEGSE